MKTLITLVYVLVAATMTAQIPASTEVDDFTNTKTTSTDWIKTSKGLWVIVSHFTTEDNDWHTMYVVATQDLGCSGAVDNYILFKFTDGTTMELEDKADIDCNSKAVSYFRFDQADFEGKTIEKVRFRQSEYYQDFEWNTGLPMKDFIQAVTH